jgi:hypothetical protein
VEAVSLPPCCWEPACGRGAISDVLAAAGRHVLSSDLNDYGYGETGVDFLLEPRNPLVDSTKWAIVANPPFKLADEFVRHALELCPTVVMLLRLAFLESVGRSDILDGGQLAIVLPFRNRLPMMHRDSWSGPRSTKAQAFAWYVWNRHHTGPASIHRLTWHQWHGIKDSRAMMSASGMIAELSEAST